MKARFFTAGLLAGLAFEGMSRALGLPESGWSTSWLRVVLYLLAALILMSRSEP